MALETVSRKPDDLLKLADTHPELDAFVKANGPMPAPPTNIQDLRNMMTSMEQRYATAYNPPDTSDIQADQITVSARDGYAIPVKTYRPKNASTPGPLIVHIHGGGFCIGSLLCQEPHCLTYVKEFGASCINIDYRLAPEHPFPTAVHDCYDVLEWAADHASDLGADPNKGFIIEGPSAGGNLADVMGHLARDSGLRPPITGLMEIVPGVLRHNAVPDEYKSEYLSWDQDNPLGLSREAAENFYALYGGDPKHHLISPFLWPPSRKDGKVISGHVGLPPVFFQVHGMDPIRDAALIYERRLREEGVKTRLRVYPGLPHGFNVAFPQFQVSRLHERDTVEGVRWLLSFSERKR
jgi:acetyl esterase/lipase